LERERSTEPSSNNVKEKNIRKKEYWMEREALNILQLTEEKREIIQRRLGHCFVKR
jgi:hypothetical protein